MTVSNTGVLQAKFNGATILTLSGVKCKSSGGYYVPSGFSRIDRGFIGSTTGSVWTSGSSISNMKQKFGVNGTYSAIPITGTIVSNSTWFSTYDKNNNGGTMIMFR